MHVLPPGSDQEWLDALKQCVREARLRRQYDVMIAEEGLNLLTIYRAKSKRLFHTDTFQIGVAFLIVCAFCIDMLEAQLLPEPGTSLETIFNVVDATMTGLFTLELSINIFAHSRNGFEEFMARPSNWFDTVIVVQSLVTVILLAFGVMDAPSAKLLRLLRLGRVVRIFRSLKSLQKLLAAVSSSILPVCNAFVILVIIAAVYAVLGTQLFRARSPEYFGDFLASLFTMFQVLSGALAYHVSSFEWCA